jgi:hypothetical protein
MQGLGLRVGNMAASLCANQAPALLLLLLLLLQVS